MFCVLHLVQGNFVLYYFIAALYHNQQRLNNCYLLRWQFLLKLHIVFFYAFFSGKLCSSSYKQMHKVISVLKPNQQPSYKVTMVIEQALSISLKVKTIYMLQEEGAEQDLHGASMQCTRDQGQISCTANLFLPYKVSIMLCPVCSYQTQFRDWTHFNLCGMIQKYVDIFINFHVLYNVDIYIFVKHIFIYIICIYYIYLYIYTSCKCIFPCIQNRQTTLKSIQHELVLTYLIYKSMCLY